MSSAGALSPCAADVGGHEELRFEDLTLLEVIGKGSYGSVYRGVYKGNSVAIKKERVAHASLSKYLVGEVAALRSMPPHPHVLRYFGACTQGRDAYLVTELMDGGDLSRLLRSDVPLSWQLRATLARDAADGLAHLHRHDLIHRDIKTENLLISDEWKVVIADYNFARKIAGGQGVRAAMTLLGTDTFMAPEVQFGEAYDDRADVFSLGLVLCEIITRREPGRDGFMERHPRHKFAADIEELRAAAPADTPPSLLECAVQCLAYEPEERLTAEMAYEWLRDLVAELQTANAASGTAVNPPFSPSEILKRAKAQQAKASGGGAGASATESSETASTTGGATEGAAEAGSEGAAATADEDGDR